MNRALVLSTALAVLSGCTALEKGHDHSRDCTYRERDLTVAWEQREYWCVPDAVRTRARVTYAPGRN